MLTERAVTTALAEHFARQSKRNGDTETPRFVFAAQVRSAAGFDAPRRFDAIAIDTWPSGGLLVHAFEVKVTRTDWLRELAHPEKAEAALEVADTMSIVAPHGIINPAEVPPGWGWYVATARGDTVRVTRRRSPQPKPNVGAPLPRTFAVSLIRATTTWKVTTQ